MAYPLAIRERVVKAYKDGQGKRAIARRYELNRATVDDYIKRAEAGKLEADSPPGRAPYLDAEGCEVLKQQVQDHPDWTLEEHSDALYESKGIRLKKSALSKYLLKMNLRYKKKSLSE
jgi:transposase